MSQVNVTTDEIEHHLRTLTAVRTAAPEATQGLANLEKFLARLATELRGEATVTGNAPDVEDTTPRALATFIPQAWVNDYAVEIDGRATFDVTDQIRALGPVAARAIEDYTYESDELWHNYAGPVGAHHDGPFEVLAKDSIAAYLEATEARRETGQ